MKLEVATDTGEVYTLEASQDLTLEDFKAAVGSQSGIPSQEISLSYRLQPLQDDKKTLIDLGLKDGELLLLERRASASSESARGIPDIDWSAIPAQSHDGIRPRARARSSVDQDDPEVVRQMFLSNPYQMALLRERNPELADAVTSGDVNRFTALLERQSRAVSDRNMEQIRLLNADHLDPNAQGRIAENIRLENVQVNLDTAIEHNPEAFGVVVMLYIECRVNGRLVKAFVDSGAQSTIMSIECAERCEIMRLVDRRFAGIARGVGMQRIVGRVHVAQVQIESAFMPCSFSIMQDQPMDMLLGLDMLKRHQVGSHTYTKKCWTNVKPSTSFDVDLEVSCGDSFPCL